MTKLNITYIYYLEFLININKLTYLFRFGEIQIWPEFIRFDWPVSKFFIIFSIGVSSNFDLFSNERYPIFTQNLELA